MSIDIDDVDRAIREDSKPKWYQVVEQRTPRIEESFHEAKEGFRALVRDIGTYTQKHPKGTVARSLSVVQIILLIAFLIGVSYTVIWFMTHILVW
jgi:hypothetical protein